LFRRQNIDGGTDPIQFSLRSVRDSLKFTSFGLPLQVRICNPTRFPRTTIVAILLPKSNYPASKCSSLATIRRQTRDFQPHDAIIGTDSPSTETVTAMLFRRDNCSISIRMIPKLEPFAPEFIQGNDVAVLVFSISG
jgi:hypothetical protein